MNPKTVEFLAKKVAATSGDARTFLELVSSAIEECRENLPPSKLAAELTQPVVKLPHAMMAVKKQNPKITDLIKSLTRYEQFTLICGVHLARILGNKQVKPASIRRLVVEAIDTGNELSLEEFKGVVERLIDSGLLKISGRFKMDNPISFDLQLEDVECALEDTFNDAFHQRIVERIQSVNVDSLI